MAGEVTAIAIVFAAVAIVASLTASAIILAAAVSLYCNRRR
jgi:hypothetical protein